MNRKKLWLLILTTVILTSFISGCIGGGQFGAPSADSTVTIKGVVVAPDNDCFTDTCSNPSIVEGEPLPNADIILQGDTHTLTGKTDCAGNYQISGLTDDGYILYANRGEVWIKKALSPVTGDGGEANYITTAQVILWEVIENTNPGAIAIKDIPTAIPFDAIPQNFIDAVKAALADCRDAQKDPTCLALAKDIAVANFGAPCGCIEPTSTPKPAPNCPIPTAVIGVPQPVEGSDGEFKFDASGSKAGRANLTITKYQWDFGDGKTLETAEPIVQHKYSETGTYQVTLVIVNSCGSSSASVGVSINYQEAIKYTVTYDANGGTGAPTDPNSPYFAGATVTVVSGVPTKANHTFAGWLYNGTTYTAGQTFLMPASNVTLVAQWTQDNRYTVTYDANGGTGAPTDPNSPYFAGATVTVVSGVPTKANHTFAGWLYNGTTYTAGQTFLMPASNVTLVAQWTQDNRYTVTYDANGGTGAPTDPNSPYFAGATVTVVSGVPTKANHTFAGWLYNGTTYTAGQTFLMPASNVTLVAQWTQDNRYTVTYDANGGTGAPTDPNSPYFAGATVTVVSGVPTKANHTFAGWLYNGTTYTAGQTFLMPASNVTLVAQWTQDNRYTVTYDANGGTGAPTDPNSPYFAGATVTVVSGVPTKANHTFAGWLYNGTTYTAGQTFLMPASNVTLVAQWTENVCNRADISDFDVTSECICPVYKSRCPDCEKCEECKIIISGVNATGTEPIQYNYGYKKAGLRSDYSMSGWTTVNGYTFTGIEECDSSTYDVIVQVKSACSETSSFDDSLMKQVTLDGGECEDCCKFDFFWGPGTKKAKWDDGKVKVQFQIKDVCQHERINLKVEVYKKEKHGDWVLHGTDNTTFTNMVPNPGGNITRNSEWESTTITGWEPGYSYEYKFTITEAQGYCSGYSKIAKGTFSNH